MGTSIKLSDLPSRKFDGLKSSINYDILQNYATKKASYADNHWIDEFTTNIDNYLRNQSVSELISKDKGCKDFNYIIQNIRDKIYTLVNGHGIQFFLIDKINSWRDNFISLITGLKCDKQNNYWHRQLKDFYDYCEDKIFIEAKIGDIQKSEKCESIIQNMNQRRDSLKINQSIFHRQIGSRSIDNMPCSHTILDTTFSHITCFSSPQLVSKQVAHSASFNHVDGEEMRERSTGQPLHTSSSLPHEDQESMTAPGANETNNDSSSNSIGLVSLPVLGISVLSFLLYKYTPLGSKFHAYFQSKKDNSINPHDEVSEQIITNTSNFKDVYTDNMQYDLSYQTI
ncbi:PIR protein [Plasmodium ovale]|uniref:PIR Superfamily Protein n=2 Tax=Plasmodium ovale TaxID=36330 RepID=A0A1A8WKX6_PLAOA|nr:PIR Superfamily Protein [Plasmodium ovale curtisi]SBT83016.1 PIR protein [Plasmodium ovale]